MSTIESVRALHEALKFKKGSYDILDYRTGKKTVQGHVAGSWGVQKMGSSWHVTHIPSGRLMTSVASLKVGKGVIDYMIKEKPALLKADEDGLGKYMDFLQRLAKDATMHPEKFAKGAAKRKKYVEDYAEEVEAILREEGLQNLGTRHAKAGTMWGIKGLARQIAVGKREIMANVFQVTVNEHYFRKPQTSWVNRKADYLTKIKPETVRKWAKWATASETTKEVLAQARREYNELDPETRYRVAVATG